MGTIFKRKDSRFLWIGFTDATGKRKNISTEIDDRAVAERMLALAEKQVRAQREAGLTEGPLTVERYAAKWIEDRRRRNLPSADQDEDRLAHAMPRIGRMLLKDVRHRHVRDLLHWMQTEARTRPHRRWRKKVDAKPLAPRTVLHTYASLRIMFSDAVVDELIPSSPCTLKVRRGELPRVVDKDQGWRDTAIFTRGEVQQIISDKRIPEWRRVLYGVMFLAGLRINEITPRKWQDYDAATEPLGQLRVTSNYNPRLDSEKPSTKNGRIRAVPVHPTLEKILRVWRIEGWAQLMGRHPQPGDLIIPSPFPRGGKVGNIINSNVSLRWFHEDLELLGLRRRRQHDARRTFISLGIADGARKEILRWVSHGPRGDVVDLYTTLPWKTLCDEVSRLNIEVLSGRVVSLKPTTA